MGSCDIQQYVECYYARLIWSVVPLFLLLFGTFGNVFNMIILVRRRMRNLSTSVYLLGLSAGDLTFLWTAMFPRALVQGYSVDIQVKSRYLCKFFTLFTGISAGFSVWVLVLMTVERWFLTRWPVLARVKLTRRTSTAATITALLLCVAFNAHLIDSADIRSVTVNQSVDNNTGLELECTYVDGNSMFYRRLWPLLVLVILNLIPLPMILLGNISVLYTILSQRRKLKQVNTCTRSVEQHSQTVHRKVKSVTKMLFFVSSMFICTTLPFTTGNVILSLQTTHSAKDRARQELAYTVLRMLLYCNFTFNFVLYCISGSVFRQECAKLLKESRQSFIRLFMDTEHSNMTLPTAQSTNLDTLDTI